MSASGQKLTANRLIQHVRLLAIFGRDATLGLSPVGAMNAGKLFLVVADTTNLVTDLRVESLLLEGLVRARSWPPIGGLFYRSLGGILLIVSPNGAPCLPLMSLSCLPLFM